MKYYILQNWEQIIICICTKNVHAEVMINTYESILGIFLVGTVVTNWPHNNVPIPKKRHQSHCSKLKLAVENAILPH
jgi:mannose/fructose/N-acetylgalactosamine-specific phosphotransferase system component IID